MTGPAPAGDLGRISALDGLRGWAALSVVIFHLTWEMFGSLFPIYRTVWVSLAGNGAFAVATFFAISGYVLTIGRWRRTDNPPLPVTLVRRYLRLEIPVFATVLVTFALMSLHLTPASEAAAITHSSNWMATFANFEPNALTALWYALVRVYWRAFDSDYVPFLWTMVVEFWGSLFVLVLSHRTPQWGVAYIALAAAVVATYLYFPQAITFPLGAMVALAQRDGWLFAEAPKPLESFIATAGVVLVLLCSAAFQVTFVRQLPSLIGGFVLFLCVMRSLAVRALLSLPLSQSLGRISFPLYLVQYPVIVSLGAWAIIALNGASVLSAWTALAVIPWLLAAIVLAAALFLPVETFTLKLIRRVGRKAHATA